jgi:hypothetical protein
MGYHAELGARIRNRSSQLRLKNECSRYKVEETQPLSAQGTHTIMNPPSLNVLEENDFSVGTAGKDPRLGGVEVHRHHPELVRYRVAPQDLDGDDERVPHQVAVHHAVEDVDRAIVGAARHEGVPAVEAARPDRALVVLEGLVGRGGQIQIEPYHPSVQRAHDQVVSRRMNV